MIDDGNIYRSEVFLVGYGRDGEVIEDIRVAYDEYYDGAPALIDEDGYRLVRGIRRVSGRIYNSAGHLQQHFENHYDDDGKYLRSRVVHEDGTVIDD